MKCLENGLNWKYLENRYSPRQTGTGEKYTISAHRKKHKHLQVKSQLGKIHSFVILLDLATAFHLLLLNCNQNIALHR